MSIASGRCANHPDRHGVGLCVECRGVVCEECTTRFEGINRCTSCLARRVEVMGAAAVIPERSARTIAPAVLGVGAFLLVLRACAGAVG